jgi:hypothetical protein
MFIFQKHKILINFDCSTISTTAVCSILFATNCSCLGYMQRLWSLVAPSCTTIEKPFYGIGGNISCCGVRNWLLSKFPLIVYLILTQFNFFLGRIFFRTVCFKCCLTSYGTMACHSEDKGVYFNVEHNNYMGCDLHMLSYFSVAPSHREGGKLFACVGN